MKIRIFSFQFCLVLLLVTIGLVDTSCKDKDKDEDITSVTDRSGNSYKVVKIDGKFWMAQNLKSRKTLVNGTVTDIFLATDPQFWSTTSPCCSWYSYNGTYAAYVEMGLLYNSHAMKTNPCPDGWHVPSAAEWNSMVNSIGGATIAGGKLKSTNNNDAYWINNIGATNTTGFTAHGSGFNNSGSGCLGYRSSAHYWTSDMSTRELAASSVQINATSPGANNGYSIRCVKNTTK